MNIILVSECTKKALTETRRIVDQFAERTGQRTWQTAITMEGVKTLHQLLRKTARRNTAVACFWVRGKNRTELMWTVGKRDVFDTEGRVPTNRTMRNVNPSSEENHWPDGRIIQILATLAALLHDLGKANEAFQEKVILSLEGKRADADIFRHEWISCQLFLLMVEGCADNEAVFKRLQSFTEYQEEHPDWFHQLESFNDIERKSPKIGAMPSVVQLITWLIATHHRMPPITKFFFTQGEIAQFQNLKLDNKTLSGLSYKNYFQRFLFAHDGWVQQSWSKHTEEADFWRLKASITVNSKWLQSLKRWAKLGEAHLESMDNILTNPLIYYLARTSLMVGDHEYSSFTIDESNQIIQPMMQVSEMSNRELRNSPILIANSVRHDKIPKQLLDQHLLGVADITAKFAYWLPFFKEMAPSITEHKPFARLTKIDKFKWQNDALLLAQSLQHDANEYGFFGVNLASTGKGKTLANAKIMYALRDEELGCRMTIALGLRTLTLQTGEKLQQDLTLNADLLAILVGGRAQKKLFEMANEDKVQEIAQEESLNAEIESAGSESSKMLLEEEVYFSDNADYLDQFSVLISDLKSKQLLNAPIVTCTIDHLMNVTECARGGRYIPPLLRLLTSDLILDEPDDFSQEDLPALARLVYMSGLLGGKVLLSSATMPPDFIAGLFDAYQSGRTIWQRSQRKGLLTIEKAKVVVGWFDEFNSKGTIAENLAEFETGHQKFVGQRVQKLLEVPGKHRADILPYPTEPLQGRKLYQWLADNCLQEAIALHSHYHTSFDLSEVLKLSSHIERSDKNGSDGGETLNFPDQYNVSVGLIRIAHIKNILEIAKAIYESNVVNTSYQIHLTIYHSRQVLLLRNELEKRLDDILNRKEPMDLIKHPEILEAVAGSTVRNHIFIVLGSPVTEVGRDHDYDWAIVEPSSQRSIIQLAGRVWRHRDLTLKEYPNIALLPAPIRSLLNPEIKMAYCFPGYEKAPDFSLKTDRLEQLMEPSEYENINAIARIYSPREIILDEGKYTSLRDLEHGVMRAHFNPKEGSINFVNCFWQEELAHHLTIHQRLISPFRQKKKGSGNAELFYIKLDEDSPQTLPLTIRSVEAAKMYFHSKTGEANERIRIRAYPFSHNVHIKPWLAFDFEKTLKAFHKRIKGNNIEATAMNYAQIELEMEWHGVAREWSYHPYCGFWELPD